MDISHSTPLFARIFHPMNKKSLESVNSIGRDRLVVYIWLERKAKKHDENESEIYVTIPFSFFSSHVFALTLA